jgi:hypothetical protein
MAVATLPEVEVDLDLDLELLPEPEPPPDMTRSLRPSRPHGPVG